MANEITYPEKILARWTTRGKRRVWMLSGSIPEWLGGGAYYRDEEGHAANVTPSGFTWAVEHKHIIPC